MSDGTTDVPVLHSLTGVSLLKMSPHFGYQCQKSKKIKHWFPVAALGPYVWVPQIVFVLDTHPVSHMCCWSSQQDAGKLGTNHTHTHTHTPQGDFTCLKKGEACRESVWIVSILDDPVTEWPACQTLAELQINTLQLMWLQGIGRVCIWLHGLDN